MGVLIALVGFSFVSSVTPGPNNVLLWASGTTYGFRATIRHVLGTAIGIGAMAILVAAGLGAVVIALPTVELAMKVAASAYLLYLAWQVAAAGALEQGSLARPLGVVQAAAFQVVNPKAWVFALGAVTAFRPAELPPLQGGLLVALVMSLVVVPTAALWAGAGGALSGLVEDSRRRRAVGLVLGATLAVTVASIWL